MHLIHTRARINIQLYYTQYTGVQLARAALGDNIGAFEFFDEPSLSAVRAAQPQLLQGLQWGGDINGNLDAVEHTETGNRGRDGDDAKKEKGPVYSHFQAADKTATSGINGNVYILIQCSSSCVDLYEPLLEWTSRLVAEGTVLEGGTTVAQSRKQEKQLWGIREGVYLCEICVNMGDFVCLFVWLVMLEKAIESAHSSSAVSLLLCFCVRCTQLLPIRILFVLTLPPPAVTYPIRRTVCLTYRLQIDAYQ